MPLITSTAETRKHQPASRLYPPPRLLELAQTDATIIGVARESGITLTGDLVATARANPDQVPELAEIKRIFEYCLGEAERTFGDRDTSVHLSIQLREDESGPETIPLNQNIVLVWLSQGRSRVGYYYEAAHEAVHCLGSDIPSGSGTHLEEAIATVFSLRIVHSIFGPEGLRRSTLSSDYQRATEFVSKIDSDVIRLGRQLREKTGALSLISAGDIQDIRPNAPEGYIQMCLTKVTRH